MKSDATWFASQEGPIRFTDLEIGEVYDARKESIASWHEIKEENYPFDKLVCSDEVIIQEQESFVGERINTPDGAIVYNFKQNLAGYTTFEINAKALNILIFEEIFLLTSEYIKIIKLIINIIIYSSTVGK